MLQASALRRKSSGSHVWNTTDCPTWAVEVPLRTRPSPGTLIHRDMCQNSARAVLHREAGYAVTEDIHMPEDNTGRIVDQHLTHLANIDLEMNVLCALELKSINTQPR